MNISSPLHFLARDCTFGALLGSVGWFISKMNVFFSTWKTSRKAPTLENEVHRKPNLSMRQATVAYRKKLIGEIIYWISANVITGWTKKSPFFVLISPLSFFFLLTVNTTRGKPKKGRPCTKMLKAYR